MQNTHCSFFANSLKHGTCRVRWLNFLQSVSFHLQVLFLVECMTRTDPANLAQAVHLPGKFGRTLFYKQLNQLKVECLWVCRAKTYTWNGSTFPTLRCTFCEGQFESANTQNMIQMVGGGKRSSKKRFDEKIRHIDSGKKHGILGPVVHANKRAFTPNNVRSRLFHASFTMFHATDPWNGLWAFATRNQLGDSFLAAKRVANFGGISLQFDMHVLYKMLLPADRHLHNYAGWLVHLVCCTRGFQCIDFFI